MQQVLGEIIPLSLVVMISPLPIVAQILLLFSKKSVANASMYLIGFYIGVAAMLGIFVVLGVGATDDASDSSIGWIRVALGVIVAILGIRRLLKSRQETSDPDASEEAEMPKWMKGIDGFTPLKSFGLATALGAVNPKNIVVGLAAAVTISTADLSTGATAGSVAIYALIASLGVAVPLLVRLVMGEQAAKTLESWKAWLLLHNDAVMGVLLAVIGVVIAGKGLGLL